MAQRGMVQSTSLGKVTASFSDRFFRIRSMTERQNFKINKMVHLGHSGAEADKKIVWMSQCRHINSFQEKTYLYSHKE